jgi:hypothetical protein
MVFVALACWVAVGCGEEGNKPLPSAGPAAKAEAPKSEASAPSTVKPPAKAAEKAQAGAPDSGDKGEEAVAPAKAVDAPQGEPTTEDKAKAIREQVAKDMAPGMVALGEKVAFPAFYGVTGPIGELIPRVRAALPKVWADEVEKEMGDWQKKLADSMGFKGVEWLDMSRGMGVILQGEDTFMVAFPVASGAQFKEALPEGTQPDIEGWYQVKDVHFLLQGDHVFVVPDRAVASQISGDLRTAVTRLSTKRLASFKMDGANVHRFMVTTLDDSVRTMSALSGMDMAQVELLTRIFNWVKEMVADIDGLAFDVDYQEGDLLFWYDVSFRPGSALGNAFQLVVPGDVAVAQHLPANSYLAFAQNLNPETYRSFVGRYADLLALLLSYTPEQTAELARTMGEMLDVTGHASAGSFHADAGFPLCMTMVTSMKDGLKFRDLMKGMYATMLAKALEQVPPEQRGMLGDGSITSMANMANMFLAPSGMKLEVKTEKHKSGTIESLVFHVDWTKGPDLGEYGWVKDIIRKQLGGAIGYTQDSVVFAFGPNAVVRIKEIFEGAQGLDAKAFFGSFYDSSRHFGVFAISVKGVMDVLLGIEPVAKALNDEAFLKTLSENRGFFMTMERIGQRIVVEYRVDLKNILDIVENVAERTDAPEASEP